MSSLRNTRLTARSVLLSVLLGSTPPRLPVGVLVQTTELFGIAEGTTRTALSRMAGAGEVVAEDGVYALASSRLLERQQRQAASRAAATRRWTGRRWLQAIVAPGARRPAAERAALRTELLAARLAELREGVWLRPDNLEVSVPTATAGVQWFRVLPDSDAQGLAASLWDLDGWAADARELLTDMTALTPPLERSDRGALADGFVLSAAVLRQFQTDPLLPAALLSDDWPGLELRAAYDRYDAAHRAVLRNWFRSHA